MRELRQERILIIANKNVIRNEHWRRECSQGSISHFQFNVIRNGCSRRDGDQGSIFQIICIFREDIDLIRCQSDQCQSG